MRARGTDDWQDNCSLFFDDSEAAIGLTEDFFPIHGGGLPN